MEVLKIGNQQKKLKTIRILKLELSINSMAHIFSSFPNVITLKIFHASINFLFYNYNILSMCHSILIKYSFLLTSLLARPILLICKLLATHFK